MSYKILSLLLFLFTTPLQALKVELDLAGDLKWNDSEKQLMQEAAQVTFERIASAAVANCAYRNIFRGPDKNQVKEKWSKQIPLLNKTEKVTLRLEKKELDGNRLGEAWTGRAVIDKEKYRFLNLSIDVNGKMIERDSVASIEGLAKEEKLNRWVNVIAHELGHNFGYHHGKYVNSWEESYPGFFVTELGYCVVSNGQYGSDKGDQKLWKQWKSQYEKKN